MENVQQVVGSHAWTHVAQVRVWLESPFLDRLVGRVAIHYHLGSNDFADLTQETRIALWQAGPETLVGPGFVVRVAANKAVSLIRTIVRQRRTDRATILLAPHAEGDPELRPLLNAQLAGLPVRLRSFYDLHYVAGYSERDIAVALGLCRASVRWLDHQCRKHLNGHARHRQTRSPRSATR